MGSYGRFRRRRSPVAAVVIFAAFTVIMGLVFTALAIQQVNREHDRAWSYEQVAFVNCHYDHTHKSTRYYDCEVGNPNSGALLYGGTTQVSTTSSRPPSHGSRWLHRVDGRVDEVDTRFPLWVSFFILLPLAGLIASIVALRRSRRRRRAGYGGAVPTGFAPPGYAPVQGYGPPQSYGPPQGFGPPAGGAFGSPTVSDEPGYPRASG